MDVREVVGLEYLLARHAQDFLAVFLADVILDFKRSDIDGKGQRGLLQRSGGNPRFSGEAADYDDWIMPKR
jgi:hypothetical protein